MNGVPRTGAEALALALALALAANDTVKYHFWRRSNRSLFSCFLEIFIKKVG